MVITKKQENKIIDDILNLILIEFKGRTDKGGTHYLVHILHVASKVHRFGWEYYAAALLHDLIEDTDWTISLLRKEYPRIPISIISAVELLTKCDGVDYEEYIDSITYNRIARKVKEADLTHNMNVMRLKQIKPKDIVNLEKYRVALDRIIKFNP